MTDVLIKPVVARYIPSVLSELLKDRTTKKNIMWATDSYTVHGDGFNPVDTILPDVITQEDSIIIPRVQKVRAEQKKRTKGKAEVFTPVWIVKKMNDAVDENYKDTTLDEYLDKMWLEITCGEAPYMCTRYDTVTGEALSIKDRVGFVDRKLQRLSAEVDDKDTWIKKARISYGYSYGYEYQGDSLFLARENLLQTYVDYYFDKFNENPDDVELKYIAFIISFNVFQMDGLRYTLPACDDTVKDVKVEIMDWEEQKMITFESLTRGR